MVFACLGIVTFERIGYGMRKHWCYVSSVFWLWQDDMLGGNGCWYFENKHLVSDNGGMGYASGFVVVCLTCIGGGFECLWVGNFVGQGCE